MNRAAWLLLLWFTSLVRGAEPDQLTSPANRVAPDDPVWKELAATFAHRPDGTAHFAEQRFFPFKKKPVELEGESRISAEHGLSLHYTEPEERTVILDARGVLVRDARGETAAPADAHAAATNAALVRVLRFDLAALAESFELYGQREGAEWSLTFVPRAAELHRVVSRIVVSGDADSVRHIELRHSLGQYVSILIDPAQPAKFSAEELKRYFR